jgi:cation transport regulator ChaB
MVKSQSHFNSLLANTLLAFVLVASLGLAMPASGQNSGAPPQGQNNSVNDDITRRELAEFNQFLDNHPEIADQLRRDPSLVDNRQFVTDHPALQSYLQDHPRIREEIKEHPEAFMRAEDRYERRGDGRDDMTREELARFNQFLDNHPEIAEQLRKDPSLVDNRQFVTNHPALQSYLQDHPRIREEIKEHPEAFMRAEDHYEGQQDRRDDITHGELARFNQFLDSHPEIAEQLRKDPSLVDNRQFVTNHPALQSYLQEHPAIRQAIKDHPEAFMQAEDRYQDHRNGGARSGEMASFGEFLGGHSTIAEQISRDPSLVRNQEYMANHPELQDYLNAHPAAQTALTENPDGFIKSAQQFDSNGGLKSPMPDPKPKQ